MTQSLTCILFGATGDLAQHKLLPALFFLYQHKQLPKDFQIIGFSRRALSNEAYREFVSPFLSGDTQEFLSHVSFQQGSFDEIGGYEQLKHTLKERPGTHIFYLATPPEHYDAILDALCKENLVTPTSRIAIEKPFGKDLASAQALDARLAQLFSEEQIFRVDHYLGKEVLQNILYFRFANAMFEPIWRSEYIDSVQLTFHETKTVEGRGKFFDGVGILRDVAQNHLMQMLAAIVMEQPKSFLKEDVRDARAHAIEAIRPLTPETLSTSVVRGQYRGYTGEKDVLPNSQTETAVALQFFMDTPRFTGVPFYLRAGKAMDTAEVSISVIFKQTCHLLFKEIGCPEIGNVLTFHIQPHEGIALRTIVKKPGTTPALETVDLHFSYKESYGHGGSDAYEKILLDVMMGDQMLFNRSDELSASWRFITNILEHWNKVPILSYEVGSKGPDAVQTLIEKEGRKWL